MPGPEAKPARLITRLASSGLVPVFTSLLAAFSSLAFFKPWVDFTVIGEGGSMSRLSGALLAREIASQVPWFFLTPAVLLGLVGFSALVLFRPSHRLRIAFGIALCALPALVIAWPLVAIARVFRNLSHLNAAGLTSVALTPWWWIYCGSLAIVALFGIMELVSAIRNQQ